MFDIATISMVLLLAMLFLLAIGMQLGFASAVLAPLVLLMKFGPDFLFGNFGAGPLNILAQRIYGLLTDYVLISIPLFIFMANLLERSGIAGEMYNSLNAWLSRTRGGIAIVTSIMAVIMAAMSGIIGGEVVLLGLIALPQMLRLGYNQNLAIGTICASGSLGTMIPPSIVLIIYGLVTDTSIKALFTAAFLPGFMLASFFIIYILITTRLNPEKAPLPELRPGDPVGWQKAGLFATFLLTIGAGFLGALFLRALFFTVTGQNRAVEGVDPITLGTPDYVWKFGAAFGLCVAAILLVAGRERFRRSWAMGKGLVAPIVVIGVVLGSIYGGITGITEAAGMGVVAVGTIAAIRGEMSFHLLWDSLKRTLRSTGTIIWVTIGATALAGAYTIAGGPTYIATTIIGADLPTMGIILVMMVIFLFLGAFMDWVGIVLLVMPVFLPIVLRLPVEEIGFLGQLDPRQVSIWFGVVFCMNMQVSFLSPPFGPAAFYLKSVAPPHISLTDIFKGFLPFIGIQILALSVLLIWPTIVTVFL
ncbi:TRAP transporter large permease [Jhaorihella thermophila]|uniref:TRAP transporter, DctM subunit n=1 Tax=Jhaorihella thermophila TaxID=488547 RepID=A0A1H5UHC5_9RHOB|nr:TRAP transporter large permease subunit [Jhaorihella thermophila]SEF74453.1 TRAP transporter, DctM subunit [Jhaorihella thermophila]